MNPLEQHQREIELNKRFRAGKPLVRRIYSDFYEQIARSIDRGVPGKVVEIGAGSGELKSWIPEAICTDLFENRWLDLVCDAYRLPFSGGSLSNLILLDVFHHLERPWAFLRETERVLAKGGRVVLFEPYISAISRVAYGCFHHEPIAWNAPISLTGEAPGSQSYYAAQGNATRLFFRGEQPLPAGLELMHARVMANFAYLFSGGLSKPALYPEMFYPALKVADRVLSRWPGLFGARCLIILIRQ